MRTRTTSVKEKSESDRASGTNVLFDVWLVSRATTGLLDHALAPTGLSADEFGLYSVLTSAETLTPTDLARWMSAPTTTVSSYIKRLESRGHAVRERNPNDGRSFVVRLTPAGRRAHNAAGAAFLPVLDDLVQVLGAREPATRKTLQLLRSSIETVYRARTGDATPAT
jgi:DNA-binding MarR family transcriptional regulator